MAIADHKTSKSATKISRGKDRVFQLVAHALLRNAAKFSRLGGSAKFVGQPILAAAGFQPALEDSEAARMTRESRLKG